MSLKLPHETQGWRKLNPFVVGSLALLLACQPQSLSETMSESVPPEDEGRLAFQRHCASCHGASGDGRGPKGFRLIPPVRNLAGSEFVNGDTREDIFRTLTEGMPGTAMASFRYLPERTRWALSDYTLSLRSQSHEGEVE